MLTTYHLLLRLACLLTAVSLSLVACEPKDQQEPAEETAEEATEEATDEAAEESGEAEAEAPAPTVDERRAALLDKERAQAEEEVTEDNADDVAAALEAEINSDLEDVEKAE
ncbi:MAG: hypothetical protein ACLFVJ_21590 [Persicimonas sp.]